MSANLEKMLVVTGLEKVSFRSNLTMPKNVQTNVLISYSNKLMLKILQGRLS